MQATYVSPYHFFGDSLPSALPVYGRSASCSFQDGLAHWHHANLVREKQSGDHSMERAGKSVPSSQRKIVARILKVRKAGDRAARSSRRFAEYRYLRAVLRAYVIFSDNDLLNHLVV